jgi:chemosensory pili system protein ChpA (sensor histidine kinase/response regulator)
MSQEKEQEIRRQFLDEAQTYITTIADSVRGTTGQRVEIQRINAALRAAHSLKGGSAMMGFTSLSDLAHRLEDNLKVLKVESSLVIDAELEHLLSRAVQSLVGVVELERQQRSINPIWLMQDIDPIFEQLRSRLGEPQAETAASVLSIDYNQDLVPLLFETEVEGCLQRLEGVLEKPGQPCLREEVVILAQELGGLGEMLQLEPFIQLCCSIEQSISEAKEAQVPALALAALQTLRQAQAQVLTGQPILVTATEEVIVHPTPELQPVVQASQIQPVTQTKQIATLPALSVSTLPSEEPDITVRVSMRQLNQLQNLLGDLTIDRNGLDLYLKRLRTLSRRMNQRLQVLQRANRELRALYDASSSVPMGAAPSSITANPEWDATLSSLPEVPSEFDLLELDRYSDVHLLSQQVMETIVQLQEVADDLDLSLDEAEQGARNLNKTAKQLQSGLTQLRMRPFADLIDRFPRAVQEWCTTYNKQVRLEVSGETLLFDRHILEMLQEPLMHLVRNAFDHGIESPQARMAQGKSAEGVIELRATQQSNRTLITIRDDGAGIPIAKIRDRAAQIGLDPTLLATASEAEILSLIFEPGFSTTDQVTELSGRGIGMDVVRTRVQEIRGEITIETQPALGTTFTLAVPVTLSTMRMVMAESDGMLFALPSDAIVEVSLFDPQEIMQTVGGEVMDYQGQIVPLVRLHDHLAFHCLRAPHDYETPPLLQTGSVLVLRQKEQWLALHVDRCWSEQEVTVRPIEPLLPMPPGFNNCVILGDGRVVPLVNVAEFLQAMTTQPQLQPLLSSGVPEPSTIGTASVLVVDDSINVRRFLALTLSRVGYRVEQAKDGQEALERLEQGLSVHAIVCDIEMPRLDGFGLLAKLKANTKLQQIPVLMLTSRSGDKHRQLAMQLGAAAYFSKPYNEQILLRSLHELIETRQRSTAKMLQFG